MMARQSVYPRNAVVDLDKFCSSAVPFEFASLETIVPRSTKTRLIQQLPIMTKEDRSKVRPDAVLLHGDKQQILLNQLFDGFQTRPGIIDANAPRPKKKVAA